jgi:hypothetical protein
VVKVSILPPASKSSTLKKASPMSLDVALSAVQPEKLKDQVADVVVMANSVKLIPLLVPSVVPQLRFLSSLVVIVRFIAVIAIVPREAPRVTPGTKKYNFLSIKSKTEVSQPRSTFILKC